MLFEIEGLGYSFLVCNVVVKVVVGDFYDVFCEGDSIVCCVVGDVVGKGVGVSFIMVLVKVVFFLIMLGCLVSEVFDVLNVKFYFEFVLCEFVVLVFVCFDVVMGML